MMDRIEVKTKAAAEKALKAGKAIRIVSGSFSLALANLSVNIEVLPAADVCLTLTDCGTYSSSAVLWGSSSAELWGSSSAVLRESSSAVLRGSSSAELWESSSAELWGSSSAVLRGSSSAVLWGSSSAVLRGSSSAVLRESSSAELWGSSSAELRESSSAVLRGSSSAELWESSSAVLRESSSAELWESSSAVLRESSSAVLWGSSSAEAFGYSMLQAHGARCQVTAEKTVAVNLWSGATATGGRQQKVKLETAKDWCSYYGVRIENGAAIVYKGVEADYRSPHGVSYVPGTTPADPVFKNAGECARGGGLNFSPTPRCTHRFISSPAHYLECRVTLKDMIVRFDGQYPEKVQAEKVIAPLVEVDVDAKPLAARLDALGDGA